MVQANLAGVGLIGIIGSNGEGGYGGGNVSGSDGPYIICVRADWQCASAMGIGHLIKAKLSNGKRTLYEDSQGIKWYGVLVRYKVH